MDGRKQLAFFFFFVFLLTYYVPFIPLLSIFMWIFTAVVFSGVLMHLFFFFFFYIYVLPLPPGSRYIKNDLDWLYLLATDSTILAYITTLAVAKILIKMCNWCLC